MISIRLWDPYSVKLENEKLIDVIDKINKPEDWDLALASVRDFVLENFKQEKTFEINMSEVQDCFGCKLVEKIRRVYDCTVLVDDYAEVKKINTYDREWKEYMKKEINWEEANELVYIEEPNEHIIWIDTILSAVLENDHQANHILHYHECRVNGRVKCVKVIRNYKYGRKNLEGLLAEAEFIEYDGSKPFLKKEIIEGILFQIHFILYKLTVYQYTHGLPSLLYLAFSDKPFSQGLHAFPFKVILLPSENDSIVWEGKKYIRREDESFSPENFRKDLKTTLTFARRHKGYSFNYCMVEFARMIKSLLEDEIFKRSVSKFDHSTSVYKMISEPEKAWYEMENYWEPDNLNL